MARYVAGYLYLYRATGFNIFSTILHTVDFQHSTDLSFMRNTVWDSHLKIEVRSELLIPSRTDAKSLCDRLNEFETEYQKVIETIIN